MVGAGARGALHIGVRGWRALSRSPSRSRDSAEAPTVVAVVALVLAVAALVLAVGGADVPVLERLDSDTAVGVRARWLRQLETMPRVAPRSSTASFGPTGHTGPAGPRGHTGGAGPQNHSPASGPAGTTPSGGPPGHTGPAGPH
jgi:hypothetical protein